IARARGGTSSGARDAADRASDAGGRAARQPGAPGPHAPIPRACAAAPGGERVTTCGQRPGPRNLRPHDTSRATAAARAARPSDAVVAAALAATFVLSIGRPALLGAQGVDVFLNVTGGGVRKLNIAIPEFTVVSGTDASNVAKQLSAVAGDDLTFSQLFSVVS